MWQDIVNFNKQQTPQQLYRDKIFDLTGTMHSSSCVNNSYILCHLNQVLWLHSELRQVWTYHTNILSLMGIEKIREDPYCKVPEWVDPILNFSNNDMSTTPNH